MNREKYIRQYYRENYLGGHGMNGQPVKVPEDIKRVSESAPCPYCGTARGLCRHRTVLT